MMQTNRINYIDRMKGFAILMVVLAHVYLTALGMGDSAVFRFCASFEMPLIMFLSVECKHRNARLAIPFRKSGKTNICNI